jgi:hypothetical protein
MLPQDLELLESQAGLSGLVSHEDRDRLFDGTVSQPPG